MFFSGVSLRFVIQKSADFILQLFPVREIQLILAYKQLVGNVLRRVFDHKLVFVCAKHNADGFIITFGIYLFTVIVQIHVHLADVLVLHLSPFQIYQYVALQYRMVKHNVDLKYSSAYIDSLLPSHKCEPLPEFQEEFADVIDQRFFKITLPMLSNTSFMVAILLVIEAFNMFESIFIMTEGGPLGSSACCR